MKRIYIIVGGIKPQWLGRRIAQWVRVNAKRQSNAIVTIVSMDELSFNNKRSEEGRHKKRNLMDADGYILIAPEYEAGQSKDVAALVKQLKQQGNKQKPVAFVSYGLEGGHKLVNSLRSAARSVNLAPLRNAVHIANPWEVIDQSGELHDRSQDKNLALLLRQLSQWMAVAGA